MNRLSRILCASALLGLGMVQGCDKAAEAKVQVEKLPEVKASLPPVPTLPPPPHPTQYSDQSYSVFGLRRMMRKTIDTRRRSDRLHRQGLCAAGVPAEDQVSVTARAPHLVVGRGERDGRGEVADRRRLRREPGCDRRRDQGSQEAQIEEEGRRRGREGRRGPAARAD